MTKSECSLRFNEIYSATSKSVLKYITSKCKRTSDINDIFQDTYLELYQVIQKHGANYVENPIAFTIRIAKHKIAQHYSLMERFRQFVSMTAINRDGDEYEHHFEDFDSALTEDFTVDKMILDTAKEYIKSKSEITRKVFYLYYDFDITISEIAQSLNISESNVKNRLYRTLNELRKILK